MALTTAQRSRVTESLSEVLECDEGTGFSGLEEEKALGGGLDFVVRSMLVSRRMSLRISAARIANCASPTSSPASKIHTETCQ